jgi:AbrB family looped-hinge helix DNA binding protein
MPIARCKVTAQGQISIPVDVRRKLGVGPGSILEWDEDGNKIVVRRAGKFTFEDIHRTIFKGRKPEKHTVEDMKEGIAQYIRDKHARR